MKDVRPALRSLLLSDAAISAMVGGIRIFPLVLPQGEKELSVVYNRISELTSYEMAGPSGLFVTRMQIDVWAMRTDLAIPLADAIYDKIGGFRGIQDDVTFHGIFMVGGREDFDNLLYRMSRDYLIWFWDR
jgi:hypothetical protein